MQKKQEQESSTMGRWLLTPFVFVLLYTAALYLYAALSPISSDVLYPTILQSSPLTRFTGQSLLTDVTSTRARKQELPVGVEGELARARAIIRYAATTAKPSKISPNIYRNELALRRSYAAMEKWFKVYVYEEGEPPLVHDGPCKNIYSTEGRFIHVLEMMGINTNFNSSIRTRDPDKAHVFFLPVSVTKLRRFIKELSGMKLFFADYVNVIASKYGYWNRTSGADHFMLSCHDWGPHVSRANPNLYNNAIRALCNANTTEGFLPSKDVSIPEINLLTGDMPAKFLSPPPDSAPRPYLAFFAGGDHGPIRPLLLKHWKGKDDDMPVFEYLPKGLDYHDFMLKSKFCLCPSGYEVASPRIVEAIYANCVPVILSEGYVLPFSGVLRWEALSVTVPVADIPRLKEVLEAVPEEKVRRLREGVKAARKHFVFNHPPKKMDVFYMIMHEIWLRRLNRRLLL